MPTTRFFILLTTLLAVAGVVAASGPTRPCPASYRCGHSTVDIRYPFWVESADTKGTRCGYPSLRLECRSGTPTLLLPSGDYAVTRITYRDNATGHRTVELFDLAVSKIGSCPLVAGRNLTLPAGSPPPLALTHRDANVTFVMNCTLFAFRTQVIPCLETADGLQHSYMFPDSDIRMPYSYSKLCESVVVIPVLQKSMVNSTGSLNGVMAAVNKGFELRWRQAVGGECGLCEKRGGSCGQRRDAKGEWTFTCFRPESSGTRSARIALWTLAIVTVLLLVGFIGILTRKREGVSLAAMNTDLQKVLELWKVEEADSGFSLYDFTQIANATGNFSEDNKLGEGGFGPVYRGTLTGGLEIAVKRLSSDSDQGLNEFKNEVQLIAKLQHRNLVRLVGCCVDGGHEKLLVYEYLNNKSLDGYIFDSVMRSQLNWDLRFKIVNGIAQGLLYLHSYSRVQVIHRDLKPSNVLLDQHMTPKISDFGLARISPSNGTRPRTTSLVGTVGYIAPECAQGVFSQKSDIFSFGVLLLEIIAGRSNCSRIYHYGRIVDLTGYAYQAARASMWFDMVDSKLRGFYNARQVLKCIHVGLLCVQDRAVDRPDMCSVVLMLGGDGLVLPRPKEPAYFNANGPAAAVIGTSHRTN